MRQELAAKGTQLAFVHMGNAEQGEDFFRRYGLDDVAHFSDPQRALYRAFGLQRGSFRNVMGWRVWKRGLDAILKGKHRVGRLVGDGLQMPGVFLMHQGRIVKAYRHETSADLPDYEELATCPLPG